MSIIEIKHGWVVVEIMPVNRSTNLIMQQTKLFTFTPCKFKETLLNTQRKIWFILPSAWAGLAEET